MFNQILSVLVSLATIIGIPIALLSYEAGQQQSGVDKAFEYYRDYHSSGLDADVKFLSDKWDEKSDEANKLLNEKDDGVRDQDFERLQASLAHDAKTQAALTRVVVFFDGLGQCLVAELCDRDTAIVLLKDPAHKIFTAYGGYLVTWQRPGLPFAHGVFIVNDPPAASRWSFLRRWRLSAPSTAAEASSD
jgi:hypothetical protein